MNECDLSFCHQDSICTNTIGSFECVCEAGFIGTGLECGGNLDLALDSTNRLQLMGSIFNTEYIRDLNGFTTDLCPSQGLGLEWRGGGGGGGGGGDHV